MPSLSPDDIARITDYVAGELTEVEIVRTRDWIAADHERAHLAEMLKGARVRLHGQVSSHIDVAERVRTLMEEIARRNDLGRRVGGARLRVCVPLLGRRWPGVVGAVGFVSVAASIFLFSVKAPSPSASQSYTTSATQQATLRLRDGTRVTLSPNAKLRVAEFDGSERRVVLDRGEAYFETNASVRTPFVVQSGHTWTRVLGTTFFVRYNGGAQRVHVAVSTGKVSVSSQASPSAVTLTAGASGDVNDSTGHIEAVNDATSESVQQNGSFVFHDAPVTNVLKMLERWYGYQFRCADSSITQQTVTVVLSMRSSSAALGTLEDLLSVNLAVAGDTITLTPQPVSPPRGSSRRHSYDTWAPTREVGR